MIIIRARFHQKLMSKPGLVLALGIASIILIGTILLNLSIASNDGQSIGFLNALFTATSAVSVTGLVVVNTAEHWTNFGKVVILLLIQIGGLGFMTMATLVALIVGKRIGLKERLIIQEQFNQESFSGIVKLTKFVIFFTLTTELIGALFLSMKFIPTYGTKLGVWYSVFHSVSAFCNAGFDILGNSMESFTADNLINFTIASLIILGGLGYTVYLDIAKNRNYRKLTMHSKIVIIVSTLLIVTGTLVVLVSEYNNPNTIGNLSFYDKVLASFFQSVVSRTAGFNSININGMVNTSVFFTIILMFIGGSPSSTAGGIKTTTFGTIIVTLISALRGKEDVEVFKKRIPSCHIMKAFILVSTSIMLVVTVTFILTITEVGKSFIDILFETISAFATVGLTRGITPELSTIGKVIITITMYLGKVGPLTLALALSKKGKISKNKYKYPEGKIIIG